MKKVIGWILVFCGILSLPGFFMNISSARDGYEVVGMLIGQGFIYFLAYLCLRNKSSEPNANPLGNNGTETNVNSYNDEVSTNNSKNEQVLVHQEPSCQFNSKEETLVLDISDEEVVSIKKEVVDSYPVISDSLTTNDISDDFPKIEFSSTSWKEIEGNTCTCGKTYEQRHNFEN